jgi:hypothetical protein
LRGANYLRDKKKIPAGEPVFTAGAADLVICPDGPTFHVARFLPSIRHANASFEAPNMVLQVCDTAISINYMRSLWPCCRPGHLP